MTNMGRKHNMTTIKVDVRTAAVVANVVRRMKAGGQKMTANQLLLDAMAKLYPDDTRLVFGTQEIPDDLEINEELDGE